MTASLPWRFDNSYATLPETFFTRMDPTPVREPELVLVNVPLAESLGLTLPPQSEDNEAALAALFTGNSLPEGAAPLAQAYAGHQFGHFSILGDGRAIVLGEHVTPDGQRMDIQFKGSGRTPYSRSGDGRAALGPMLREYVISEAMAALGIPTTRSLAVASTGEPVYRESVLPGAVLTRVASSHLRVGTFEFASARSDKASLAALVTYALERHGPDGATEADNPALELLKAMIDRQSALITEWMRVGFIHGVMNTDNMTVSGETIDYGPCAFLDDYDPKTTFSSIDHGRRYAFGNQPGIALWNLSRFAEALLPLIAEDPETAVTIATETLTGFQGLYAQRSTAMMRRKLGLIGAEDDDSALIYELLSWMEEAGVDYTNGFRSLSAAEALPATGQFGEKKFQDWQIRWQERLSRNTGPIEDARALMAAANPVYIPRNHKVEEALDAASENGNLGPVQDLLKVVAEPYRERPGLEAYTRANPAPPGSYHTFCGT
ncbi:MAG: protein adenylyltransferase SelO [Rhodospirillaceae bacterium]